MSGHESTVWKLAFDPTGKRLGENAQATRRIGHGHPPFCYIFCKPNTKARVTTDAKTKTNATPQTNATNQRHKPTPQTNANTNAC
jgi:hypothetical protein